MITLRVLLSAPPAKDVVPWATFGTNGELLERGRCAPGAWPRAARTEAVLAASRVRIACVDLPPLPPQRLRAAASYALEDRLAGPADEHHVAVAPQARDGRVRAVVAARSDIAALAESREPVFARILAESDLAPVVDDWLWLESGAGGGFVRLPDGSAFPIDRAADADGVPAELAIALAGAARDGHAPRRVVVAADASDEALARWSRDGGTPFERGARWQWEQASAKAFDGAIDLRQGIFASAAAASTPGVDRALAPALRILALAALVYIGAAITEWTWLTIETSRRGSAWRDLAQAAGVAAVDAQTPSAWRAAIARRHAEHRHARGLAAPSDALPLLARAAPALRSLPADAVKGADYGDGHWTFDLARIEPAALQRLDEALRAAGTPALVAHTGAGARVRVGLP